MIAALSQQSSAIFTTLLTYMDCLFQENQSHGINGWMDGLGATFKEACRGRPHNKGANEHLLSLIFNYTNSCKFMRVLYNVIY